VTATLDQRVAAAAAGAPSVLRDLVALCKPGITRMNVLMVAGGLALAGTNPGWSVIVGVLVGSSLAIAAANVLNQYLERDGDKLMARTAVRPLPTGRMQPEVALHFGRGLAFASLAVLALAVNTLTAALALFAMVSYVLVYTPLKRMTPLAVVIGAVPGAIPPLMGWTAATNSIDLPGVALFGILLAWQIPHFLAISLFRFDDYKRAGIKTVPVVRGEKAAVWQAIAWSVVLLAVSVSLVPLGIAGPVYGAFAAALGLWYLGYSILGVRRVKDANWARRYFFASLIYLPAVTLVLALDVAFL
jgi:protoheme IX farnesyltransferase